MSSIEQIATALEAPIDAPQMAQAGDLAPERGDDRFSRPEFPLDSPVKPLGILGQLCWYLDVNGQIISLEANNRHGKNSLVALFGMQSDWLEKHWPQWSKPVTKVDRKTGVEEVVKPSEIVGFKQDEASRALIEACAAKGIFDPTGKIRGRGAHRGRNGGLVIHFGDQVLFARTRINGDQGDWRWHPAGVHDGFVYGAGIAMPRPWHEPVDERPGQFLLKQLKTWNWVRPMLDPVLLLGWITLAPIGGALEWRPNIWITGGKGTGKSTLNGKYGIIARMFGDGKLKTGNTSAAAIRQILRNSTIPVMIDEIEAEENNARAKEVIELARVSSSGDDVHRGGADHHATQFTLESSFQFSSVLIPPMKGTDRSRLGILELNPFAEDAVEPDLDKMNLPILGQKMMRRMIDQWPRWAGTLALYEKALRSAGHSQRACNQFGALLGAADCVLDDDLPDDERIAAWVKLCDRHSMAEISETLEEHTACLNHLITNMVQARGGDERESIGTWLGRAVHANVAMGDLDKSRERLQELGLKLVNARWNAGVDGKPGRWGAAEYQPGEPGFLAIAGSHRALATIYQGTTWQGGVWDQALRRTPGSLKPVKCKFARMSLTACLVPLCQVLDETELPAASKPDAYEEWRARMEQN